MPLLEIHTEPQALLVPLLENLTEPRRQLVPLLEIHMVPQALELQVPLLETQTVHLTLKS